MQLCGEVVKHKAYGLGQIIEVKNNYVTVLFDKNEGKKKFLYPSAFGTFIEIENKSFIKEIEECKNAIALEVAEKKRINNKRIKEILGKNSKCDGVRKPQNATAKTSDKNNVAFKCNYCDGGRNKDIIGYKGVCSDETIKYNINNAKFIGCRQEGNMCYKYLNGEVSREEVCDFYEKTKSEFSNCICYESQMLEIWVAGAGIAQNAKGKPTSLRNARANSLAVLTTKLPHSAEKDRLIFAIYLIDQNYKGDNKEVGYVASNPKYRIQLSLDEAKELKFWDYYFNPNKVERIAFGSGLHRYLTDIQSAQVLMNICKIKKGTSEEELSEKFLEHYCKIKNLDINNIPMPNGALQRLR